MFHNNQGHRTGEEKSLVIIFFNNSLIKLCNTAVIIISQIPGYTLTHFVFINFISTSTTVATIKRSTKIG